MSTHVTQPDDTDFRGMIAEEDPFHAPCEMLERLAVTAELREDSSGERCYRIGKLASLLAHEAGVDAATCWKIELAARLHDIGTTAIPDTIVLKPGKLTEAERKIMRAHASVGADMLARSGIPRMGLAEQVARHHHDWWDGSNEDGLAGEQIPFAARVTAIADVFDALTHGRIHREAWSVAEALQEIVRLKGTQFDPHLAGLFAEMILRLRREQYDLDAFLGAPAKSSRVLQDRSRIRGAPQPQES
jgi:putative two-component system response regulator